MLDFDTIMRGGWVARDREALAVTNPANGEVVGSSPLATPQDADEALGAAARAFVTWQDSAPAERHALLQKAADLLQERLEATARLLTLEQGKPLADSRKELKVTVRTLRLYAEEALRIEGPAQRGEAGTSFSIALRQPIGPVVAIAPTNYPVELMAWKVAPALAAGCTVVAKPPPETPLATAALIACLHEAGAPEGSVTLLVGGADVGEALIAHPLSRKVAFTGSTAVGRRLATLAGQHLKPVTLELGGHAPYLVFADSDLEKAVAGAVRRSYSNAGQICIAVNRVYVEAPIFEDFVAAFADTAGSLRVADGLQVPDADMGPLVSERGATHVEAHVQDAVARGATVLTGGRRLTGAPFEHGHFYSPTVLTNVNQQMRCMNEETFGPLTPIAPFEGNAEALRLANASTYGLAAYVYTRDLQRAMYLAAKLEAGGVGINVNDTSEMSMPFGGWKESGYGRELGRYGLENYLQWKHVRLGF